MRKLVIYLSAVLLVVVVLGLAVAGCGDASSAPKAGADTPEAILSQAMAAGASFDKGTGQFDLSLAVNGDTATMPAEMKAILGQPITISGTFSGSQEPMAADVSMTVSLAGQNIPLGLKMTDGKAWIQFMGTWYEAPDEIMSQMSTATTDMKATQDSILQAFKTAGIDINTWITDLKTVGEDDLDGTKAYHLSGNIALTQIVNDAVKMMQNEDLMKAIPGMDALGEAGTDMSMPTGDDLAEMQQQLDSMFETLTADVWITKDDYQLRKVSLNAKMVPPTGEDAQGIDDITMSMNLSMAPTDAPVTVTPPASSKPFSELEQALGMLEGMFSGLIGG